jgi:glycerol uptake facilitator-like aquaporin
LNFLGGKNNPLVLLSSHMLGNMELTQVLVTLLFQILGVLVGVQLVKKFNVVDFLNTKYKNM